MKTAAPLLLLFFLITACNDDINTNGTPTTLADSVLKERWMAIKQIEDSIRAGDLVVRCGNDYTSETLRDFSQHEKLYSHSGIALMDNGVMYIYSNMAGDINPDEVMRRDKVDSFLTPVNNVAAGVYRYDFSPHEIEKLKTIVNSHYNNKLQFDMNFDPATDNKMYCAEMIAKSVEQATEKRITIPKSMVNDELRQKYLKLALEKKVLPSVKASEQREYWSIDDLYLNPYCHEIKKVIFGDPKKPIKFPTPENYQH